MSEIILNWLNDEIQLSRRILNFQQDFNNGYLFGQLLSKYNQQLNFNEFENKDDKKSKIKNFQLLFDTFTSLGVSFNSLIANDIINKKIGVSKKILYELKMHLEKTNNTNQFTKMTKMTKTQLSPLKKLKLSKDQYDKVDKEHFIKQLNELHPAQKTINQDNLLKKFSDFHQEQIKNNLTIQQKQQQNKLSQQKKFRDRERDNLKKTADFRNQWQRTNMQKWAANMTVRHMQKDKDEMFKTKLKQTKIQNKTMSEMNAIKALDRDINQFERKFIKNKKLQNIDDSDESQDEQVRDEVKDFKLKKKQSKLNSKLKLSKLQSMSFSEGLKKKPAPQVTQQQKHQRQKKRRKMIVEQNKRFQLIEISRRQKYILSTIQQTSKQQKQLEYEIWRVWQNKQIIKQNKRLQQSKQKQKNEIKQINNKFKREQLLKTYREEHQIEIKDGIRRQEQMLNNHKVKERKETYLECKEIINKFINITEECFKYQQQKNQEQISKDLVDHLFSEFVEDVKTSQEKTSLELDNYIHGKGEWDIKLKVNEQQNVSNDPTQDNAIPITVINNYALGNILRMLYSNKYNKNVKNAESQSIQQRQSSEFILSLMGLQFSGKHLAAQTLRNKFGFNVIEIQKLILKKIQEYQQIKDKVSEISELTRKLVECAYKGDQIPNNLIIELLQDQLKNNPKSIIINYPITYEQSLDLVKSLKNIQPKDFIEKDQFQKKIQSFSRLVWPTQSKIVPRPLKQCGLDMALWIDVNNKASFDRFLGRRWIGENIVHVNDEVADEIYRLQMGEKSSALILKNHEKIIQKNKLQEFFNEFGIQVIKHLELEKQQKDKQNSQKQQKQEFRQENNQNNNQLEGQIHLKSKKDINQQVQAQVNNNQQEKAQKRVQIERYVRNSWQSISGMCTIQELQNKVIQIVDQAIRIKNMKTEDEKQKLIQKQLTEQKALQERQKQDEIRQKCVFSSHQLIRQKLKIAVDSVTLDEAFIQNLCSLWDNIEGSTITALKKIFKAFSDQERDKNDYISSTKRNYINTLTREDRKFSLVKDFQIKYNKFYQEYPDMISQDYTKDELHQRVDDLQDQLFNCIEQKKQDSIQERKNIMESGWIESQLDQFYNCVRIMLQTELNRYTVSEKIIGDFYSKKYAVPLAGNSEESQIQINYDTTQEMFTKEHTFPRLNKLINDTMKIFNKEEEVVDDKNKKGGKAPPAKKDDKKGAKKIEVQQSKQPTSQQLQMKRAINIQKSIFRYRVNIIQEFSLKKISELVRESEKLYKQIESYYLYTYEIQNKCVLNLSKILRNKIEREEKIENEVQINYVDVVVSELIRNFEKQKPVIQPAREKESQDRFTIANIFQVIKFIQNESESNEKVSTKRLIYLLNLIKNNQNEKQILPIQWRSISQQKLQEFVYKLDSQKKGFIELWKIFFFVAMSNINYPSEKELKEYYQEITSYGTVHDVEKEKFIQCKAWFDQEYFVEENTRVFQRNELLKEIIFDLIKIKGKNEKEYVHASDLMEKINLRWFQRINGQKKQQGLTYFDIAFV